MAGAVFGEVQRSLFVAGAAFGEIVEGSLNSKLPTLWRVEKQMKSR